MQPLRQLSSLYESEMKTECVLFPTKSKGKRGTVWINGRKMGANRAAWIARHGEIPNGMFVLHKCDNPQCVNSEHLFLGTQLDNMRDMHSKGRNGKHWNGKTHCKSGHLLIGRNIYNYVKNGRPHRSCRRCRIENVYRRQRKLDAIARPVRRKWTRRKWAKCDDCGDFFGRTPVQCQCGCTLFKTVWVEAKPIKAIIKSLRE